MFHRSKQTIRNSDKTRINMKGIINIIGRTLIERGFFEMRLIWVWIF